MMDEDGEEQIVVVEDSGTFATYLEPQDAEHDAYDDVDCQAHVSKSLKEDKGKVSMITISL